ncbi:MAG TPA: tetratricopeptide repeat protein [Spirochaetota bacterium]|nr:tetratricopeptide repeat protein [Spirochaetota bacterium]HPR49735.1 tetratricopeptide repeat protein [Spirochaetota bacterium]
MRKLSIIYFTIIFATQLFAPFTISTAEKRITDHSWNYYYEKAKTQAGLEIYDEAIFNARKAFLLKPDLYQAAELLGDIYVIKNKRMTAQEYYQKSLKIKEDQPDLHCKAGELYEFHAEKDLALKHFKRAVELDPSHVRANNDLVRFYFSQGKRDLAEQHFRVSYNAGITAASPYLKKARQQEKIGNRTGAIAHYEKAIEAGPATLEAYIGIYENNRILSRFGEAIDALKRLLFVKPDHVRAHIWLGHLYFNHPVPGRSRKYCIDQAVRHLEKARELDPADPQPCYILSDLYRVTGDDLAAEKYHSMAQSLEMNKNEAGK